MCGPGYHTMTWGGSTAAPDGDPPNLRCDCGMVNRRDFLAYDSDLQAARARAARLEAEVKALREAGDRMATLIEDTELFSDSDIVEIDAAAGAWRALRPSGGREDTP